MVGLLAPGTDYLACVETALPTSGQHVLAAVVDAPRAVTEFNEANNVYEQLYTAPAPTPSAAQADLTVSAIRVNGRAPDGKDDCKDGKNDVTVVVRNGGTADAGNFAVRLVEDKSVPGLDAGKEREVRFDDVRLKEGKYELSATADAKETVAESDESNNDLKVTARCGDDD
jgi:subtilase family serine protease